jgi:hypothetical protein
MAAGACWTSSEAGNLDDSALHPAPLQQLHRLAHSDDGGQQPPVHMAASSHAATCTGGNREDQAGATDPHTAEVTDAGIPISSFSGPPVLPRRQKPQMKLRLMDWGLPPGIVEVMQEPHSVTYDMELARLEPLWCCCCSILSFAMKLFMACGEPIIC